MWLPRVLISIPIGGRTAVPAAISPRTSPFGPGAIAHEVVDGVSARIDDHRMAGAKLVLRAQLFKIGDVVEFAGPVRLAQRNSPQSSSRQAHRDGRSLLRSDGIAEDESLSGPRLGQFVGSGDFAGTDGHAFHGLGNGLGRGIEQEFQRPAAELASPMSCEPTRLYQRR